MLSGSSFSERVTPAAAELIQSKGRGWETSQKTTATIRERGDSDSNPGW